MRIIKEGKIPEEQTLELNCSRCRCQFEIKYNEGKYTSDQRDGDFYQINCPTCGHVITYYPPGYCRPSYSTWDR